MGADAQLSFGILLKRFRRSADLTQVQLAASVGLSPATIRAYELERRLPPRPTHLQLFFDSLKLTSDECTLLAAAAARARARARMSWTDTSVSHEGSNWNFPDMPQGLTPEAREAVMGFGEWYRPLLADAMATSLSVIIWQPQPETDGPIAMKRRAIRAKLQSLGHLVDEQSLVSLAEQRDDHVPQKSDALDAADLILIVAEDDPTVIDQVTSFCRRTDVLPNVRALLPERYETVIEAELNTLIYGFNGVYWYRDTEIEQSNLVKEALRCSEARRKVKAFKGRR